MKPTTILAIALILGASGAWAADYTVGNIEIDGPWSRATPKGAKVASGYLKITNTGSTPDRLTGGTFIPAGGVEIHEMSVDRGVMRMRELKGGLEIKPGETVELQPSSIHLMFTNLRRPLAKGEHVKGTLVFEKAGSVEVEYAVEPIGASKRQPSGHPGH
ncbi:MAG: copper chaperone PCu(A)C [Xanthobacteraceae bacterium]|jgi:periplasmic copper chaperone A